MTAPVIIHIRIGSRETGGEEVIVARGVIVVRVLDVLVWLSKISIYEFRNSLAHDLPVSGKASSLLISCWDMTVSWNTLPLLRLC